MLLGLTRPDAGTILIACQLHSTSSQADVLARVGAVIEEPRFHNHLTGRENLRVIAAARGPQVRAAASSQRLTGWGSPTAVMTGSAVIHRGCASGWASPAACSPTRS